MDPQEIVCPPISDALIRYLEEAFPDVTVDPRKEDPLVAFGKASVVRHLKAVQHEQEEAYVPT